MHFVGLVDRATLTLGMKSGSLRAYLRQQTHSLHEELDQGVGAFDSPLRYRAYVRGVCGFRSVVEPAMQKAGASAIFAGFTPTFIHAEAISDMEDLGIEPAPGQQDIETKTSPGAILGALYVIEGSTLGAQLLYKRAQELGFHAQWGARHLHAQTNTDRSWSKLQAFLDASDVSDRDDAELAAKQMFTIAIQAFKAARL